MTTATAAEPYVLAVSPSPHGIACVLLEGPHNLRNWVFHYVRTEKNPRCFKKVKTLIAEYQPTVLVTEDPTKKVTLRSLRTRLLVRQIDRHAKKEGLATKRYSRQAVKEVFRPFRAQTRHEIAVKITEWFPELAQVLPPKRKPWESDYPNLAIFHAMSLAISYFAETENDAPGA